MPQHDRNTATGRSCNLVSLQSGLQSKPLYLINLICSEQTREDIVNILERISSLKPPERLLLYMRMPSGAPETGKTNMHVGGSAYILIIYNLFQILYDNRKIHWEHVPR